MLGITALKVDEMKSLVDVIDGARYVHDRGQFTAWAQGELQHLLPHEIMLCWAKARDRQGWMHACGSDDPPPRFLEEIGGDDGIPLVRLMERWRVARRPLLLCRDSDDCAADSSWRDLLARCALSNLAAHGVSDMEGNLITFFCFSCLPGALGARHVRLLELLVPHLHVTLLRALNHVSEKGTASWNVSHSAPLTDREAEVLRWVRAGKNNWEISVILDISQVTVKNHVGKILRKLGAENRGHAVALATGRNLI